LTTSAATAVAKVKLRGTIIATLLNGADDCRQTFKLVSSPKVATVEGVHGLTCVQSNAFDSFALSSERHT
jgi:hypothetical protein